VLHTDFIYAVGDGNLASTWELTLGNSAHCEKRN